MNTNYGLPSGWTVMQQPKWKPYALQSLIDTNPYPAALAKLQKQKEDCGYTFMAIETSGIKTNCGR